MFESLCIFADKIEVRENEKMSEKDKALTVISEEEKALLAEAVFETEQGGFGNVTADNLKMPRLKLAQSLSKVLDEDDATYVPSAKVGDFTHSITKTNFCKSLSVIVLRFEQEVIEWQDGERGTIVDRYTVAEAEKVALKKGAFERIHKDTKNPLEDTYSFFLMIVGNEHESPVIFALSKTGISSAKTLITQITTRYISENDGFYATAGLIGKRAPQTAQVYTLTAIDKSKANNKWKLPIFEFDRFATLEEFKAAKAMFDIVKKIEVKDIPVDSDVPRPSQDDIDDSAF